MDITGNIDIHFHKEDVASIKIVHNAPPEYENLLNLLWFSTYTLRQIILVGPTTPPASQLTSSLSYMAGRGTIEELVLADDYRCSIVRDSEYSVGKGFKSEIFVQSDSLGTYNSKIRPYGFSIFGMGINSYAMVSVLALLRYFAENKKEDKEFLSSLAFISRKIGFNFDIDPEIPSPTQERALALKITEEALNYKEK
jgi:hypothetical protein